MFTGQNRGTECNDGGIVPMIGQNSRWNPFASRNDVPGGHNPVLEWGQLTVADN